MTLLRLILVLLLTLALPFAGATAVAMPPSSSCPMQSEMSHSMAMPAGHDCCQAGADGDLSGPASKAKPSSPCKPGQECQVCTTSSPAPAALGVQPLVVPPVLALAPTSFIPSHDPAGWWRPPPTF